MPFIPLYYTSSSLLAWQGKDPYKKKMPILTGNTDNYDLDLATPIDRNQTLVRVFEISSSAAVNLTGVVAPAAAQQGIPYFLVNTGNFTITIVNAATSTAANQFNNTSGGNVSLTAGSYLMMVYEAGSINKWTVGESVPQGAFKLEVPSANGEGVLVAFDNAFWSAHNTGNYNSAGTKTANANDVYYAYGVTAPTRTYGSTTAATRASIPVESGRDELIQVPRSFPLMYWLAVDNTSLPITVRFRKNEQGYGLNKQQ